MERDDPLLSRKIKTQIELLKELIPIYLEPIKNNKTKTRNMVRNIFKSYCYVIFEYFHKFLLDPDDSEGEDNYDSHRDTKRKPHSRSPQGIKSCIFMQK